MSHPDVEPVLKQQDLAAHPLRARDPVPPADLVVRRVRNAMQVIAGHERIHVVQLVRVEVQEQRRDHAGRRSDRVNGSCSIAGNGSTAAPWLTCCGMCVCWLRSSRSSIARLSRSQAATRQERRRSHDDDERSVEPRANHRVADHRAGGPRFAGRARTAAAGSSSSERDRSSRRAGIQNRQQTLTIVRSSRPSGRGTSDSVVGSRSCQPVHGGDGRGRASSER